MQGVLFTIMPWRAPLCVERVWCLYEALQAVSAHVALDLLVEEMQSGQSLDKLQQLFTKVGSWVGFCWLALTETTL